MIPNPVTDHVDRAIDRLIEHYQGDDKPVLHGLIRAYVQQIQDLEDALWQVLWGRLLDPAPGRTERAEGVQLDVLGKIVGRDREGMTDDDFRHAIRLQMLVNRSMGKPEDLIGIVRFAVGPSGVFAYHEEYHHVMLFSFEELTVSLARVLYRVLQSARAAGTRAVMEYFTDRVNPSTAFRWGSNHSGSVTGGNGGFGDALFGGVGGILYSRQG